VLIPTFSNLLSSADMTAIKNIDPNMLSGLTSMLMPQQSSTSAKQMTNVLSAIFGQPSCQDTTDVSSSTSASTPASVPISSEVETSNDSTSSRSSFEKVENEMPETD